MCVSPQWRAIFRHLNLQSALNTSVFCGNFHFPMCFGPQGRKFFDIWTSKSVPKMTCFVHFDFAMGFSPQWRTIFDMVLYILTWQCGFRHSGRKFLISHLSSYLCTRFCNRPICDRIIEKTRQFGISRSIFFLLTFALLHLLSAAVTYSAFQLSPLSEVPI